MNMVRKFLRRATWIGGSIFFLAAAIAFGHESEQAPFIPQVAFAFMALGSFMIGLCFGIVALIGTEDAGEVA